MKSAPLAARVCVVPQDGDPRLRHEHDADGRPILATALVLIHRNYTQGIERINDAMIDPVTGLHNQRFVTAHVARELTRARREHDSVALVADALKGVRRGTDVCGRHGGDEFDVLNRACSAHAS